MSVGASKMFTFCLTRQQPLPHHCPERFFHPLIALRVHVVGDEVVVGLTADAFVILAIVPDRVVGTEVLEAGAVVGYTARKSLAACLNEPPCCRIQFSMPTPPSPPTPSASGLRLGL